MYDPSSIDRLYIEFDARLSAMKTFLYDLPGDPGARPFLLRFTDGLRATLAAEGDNFPSSYVDDSPIHHSLQALYRAVTALPEDGSSESSAWRVAQQSHRRCEVAFSQFRRELRSPAFS